jgi:hypothetical protein
MSRALLALLLLLSAAHAQIVVSGSVSAGGSISFNSTAVTTPDCGTSSTIFTDCGPTAGTVPTCSVGATDITGSLPYTIVSAGAYKITADAGVGASTDQIILSAFLAGAVEICGVGTPAPVLTGRINFNGSSRAGMSILNLNLQCDYTVDATSNTNIGCMRNRANGGAYTGGFLIDHMTVKNSASASGAFQNVDGVSLALEWTTNTAAPALRGQVQLLPGGQ